MAVSLLDSGNTGVVTGGSTSINVTVSAGAGNRKLLVGVACESSTNALPSSITFNGQDLVSLGLEVSGTLQNPDSFASTVFYEQFDGGMPSPGTSALAVTWDSATGDKAVFYWLVDGCDQGNLATGAGNNVAGAGGAGTTIGTSITAGDTAAFLASVGYKNNTTGTLQLTAPGSSTTDGDLSGAGSGDRLGGGHKTGSLTAGSNTVTWTHSSESRRAMSVVVVNPAADERALSGGFTLGPVTTAADITHRRELSGGPTLGAVTTTGDISAPRNLSDAGPTTSPFSMSMPADLQVSMTSAALSVGPITTTGSILHQRELSGALDIGTVTLAADITHRRELDGAIAVGPVTVVSDMTVLVVLSGGPTLAPVTTAGDISTDTNADLSGAIAVGPITTTGDLSVELALSGALTLAPVTVDSSVGVLLQLSGAVQLGPVTLAADASVEVGLSGGPTLSPVVLNGSMGVLLGLSGGPTLGAVTLSADVTFSAVPGTVTLSDSLAGSVLLSDQRVGSLTLSDAQAGTVTL